MNKKILSIDGQFLAVNDSLIAMPDINLQDKTVTPQQNAQVVVADAEFTGLNKVTVEAMPAGELSAPTISEEGVITASVATSGYIASGISKTLELPTQEAQTIMPTTADQIIPSQKYLVGNQTIKGDANLVPENIAEGKNIFGITGSFKGGEDVSAELTEQDDIIALMQAAIATKSAAGVAEPFAFITVTYPEGSVCTCADGVETLTAKNTDGTYVFCVPHEGEWTVTSTDPADDVNTKSQSVEITEEGQFKDIFLSYKLYLFKSGRGLFPDYSTQALKNTTFTADVDSIIWAKTDEVYFGNIFQFQPAVDISEFTKLNVEFKCTNRYSTAQTDVVIAVTEKFRTGESEDTWVTLSKSATKSDPYNTELHTVSLDVSKTSGEWYVAINGFGISGEVYNVWFEK